jgi:RNA polymerase-binding transcription factor DksA
MDEIDIANDRADAFVDSALKAALAGRKAPPSTGICAACEQPIEPERLLANPTARLCHDCAEDAEAERRRAGRTGQTR